MVKIGNEIICYLGLLYNKNKFENKDWEILKKIVEKAHEILRVLYNLRPYISCFASLYKPFWLLSTYFDSSNVKRALPYIP